MWTRCALYRDQPTPENWLLGWIFIVLTSSKGKPPDFFDGEGNPKETGGSIWWGAATVKSWLLRGKMPNIKHEAR